VRFVDAYNRQDAYQMIVCLDPRAMLDEHEVEQQFMNESIAVKEILTIMDGANRAEVIVEIKTTWPTGQSDVRQESISMIRINGRWYIDLEFLVRLNDLLAQALHPEGLNMDSMHAAMVERENPENSFWTLLVGTNEQDNSSLGIEAIILARVDPTNRKMALISIPRDTRVSIEGYGYQRISDAYALGELNEGSGHSGAEFTAIAVSGLTGAGIASYMQINKEGFINLVEIINGVEVEVPIDIYLNTEDRNDTSEAISPAISAGRKILDGNQAFIFVSSTNFDIGDFQSQANQRTMLQAIAKQVLVEDPLTIMNVVTAMAQMTATTMSSDEIVSIATSLRGMQETDIYTYSIPCQTKQIDGVLYEIPNSEVLFELIAQVESGNYPSPESLHLTRQGVSPQSYWAWASPSSGQLDLAVDGIITSNYLVDVRNGYGNTRSATEVMEKLVSAGFQRGESSDANSFVYTETLIIYREDSDREAAEGIQSLLGFGRLVPSFGRYSFSGDILVIIGGDYEN